MHIETRTTVPRPNVQLSSVLVGTIGIITGCEVAFVAGSKTCPVDERGWFFRIELDIVFVN